MNTTTRRGALTTGPKLCSSPSGACAGQGVDRACKSGYLRAQPKGALKQGKKAEQGTFRY